MADRAQADRRSGAPDHLLYEAGHLLATRSQGPDLDGEQHFQQLAHGGCLARQVTFTCQFFGSAAAPQGLLVRADEVIE